MTLEDILKIDTCPFDDTVLDEYITGNYHASSPLRANLCNLILRYLNLFWEKYQPELVRTYDPTRLVGADDEAQEDYCFWDEEMSDIMHTAVNVNGWKCMCFRHECGDIEVSGDSGGSEDSEEERFHKAYMEFLDECGVEGFARKFFENEEKLVNEAVRYTDYFNLGILLNDSTLQLFKNFIKKNIQSAPSVV